MKHSFYWFVVVIFIFSTSMHAMNEDRKAREEHEMKMGGIALDLYIYHNRERIKEELAHKDRLAAVHSELLAHHNQKEVQQQFDQLERSVKQTLAVAANLANNRTQAYDVEAAQETSPQSVFSWYNISGTAYQMARNLFTGD